MKTLRASEISKLPDGLYRADHSLYLLVRGSSRSWTFIVRVSGKQLRRSLGSAQLIPLTSAKTLALKIRTLMETGSSLEEAIDAAKGRVKPVTSHTFYDIATEAINVKANVAQYKEGTRSRPRLEQFLRDYCIPLHKIDVDAVTRDDVLSCLKPIWETKSHTAERVRQFIRMVLNYAILKEYRQKANVAEWEGGLDFLLPRPTSITAVTPRAAPSFEELKAACAVLKTKPGYAAKAILFGILTATRVSEFRRAKLSDIDLKTATWTLPADERKGRHTAPHRVPLSKQALEIVKSLHPTNDYLFPGQRGAPFLGLNTPRILLNRVLPNAKTMHGVRSTFKDWATENGWDRDLSEKALSHKLGRNDVEAAYLRTDLFKQRAPLMQAWADALLPR